MKPEESTSFRRSLPLVLAIIGSPLRSPLPPPCHKVQYARCSSTTIVAWAPGLIFATSTVNKTELKLLVGVCDVQRCDVMNCIHFSQCSRHWRFVLQTEISGKYNSRLHFCFLYILLAIIRYTYYSVAVKAYRHVLCDLCRHFIGRSYVAVFSAMSLRRNFLTLPQASFKDIYYF